MPATNYSTHLPDCAHPALHCGLNMVQAQPALAVLGEWRTDRGEAGITVGRSFAWRGGNIPLAQDQVSELRQLPVRGGGAEAFFDVE